MEGWKEYFSIETLTLIVAVLTLFISLLAYRYAKASGKRDIQRQIACKNACIKALENYSQMGGEFHQMEANRAKIAELEAEIEQLERLL